MKNTPVLYYKIDQLYPAVKQKKLSMHKIKAGIIIIAHAIIVIIIIMFGNANCREY